ncbi:MAG: alpha/beta fold hydrolase [Rudaea sp.]
MSVVALKNSTLVRKAIALALTRAAFVVGGVLSPRRTAYHAARLFATPFASSRSRARAAPIDADMRRADLHIGGRSIATYVWGDPAAQPYVLFSHGWSSFGLRFAPWVPRLRRLGYAVVTFDQAGHGQSSGRFSTLPDFADTLRAVGQHFGNPALLVAHSFGGPATALAQDASFRPERIVLIAPASDISAAVRRFFRFIHLSDGLREHFFAWHKRRTGIDARDLALHDRLPAFSQPALIVHDLDDYRVPWGEGEYYARLWPGARLLTTTGLGHNRIVDDAAVIEQALSFARGERVGDRVIASPNLRFGFA